MSKVIALHLNAPLQSWAGRSLVKTHVDTGSAPSERALRGLIAAAFGFSRIAHGEKYPEPVSSLEIEVFPLKEGHVERDYQIIGDRSDEAEYLQRVGRILADGKKRGHPTLTADGQGKNAVVHRTYLGDASFLVLVKGADEKATAEVLGRLRQPVFSPYLGKKAFPPIFPFLLGEFEEQGALKSASEKLREIQGMLDG